MLSAKSFNVYNVKGIPAWLEKQGVTDITVTFPWEGTRVEIIGLQRGDRYVEHRVPCSYGGALPNLVAGLNRLSEIPDLGISFKEEYRKYSRSCMGWGIEDFHVEVLDQWRWMTSKEWRLLLKLRKYSGVGRFSPCSSLWDMYLDLKHMVEVRYGGFDYTD